MASSRNNNNKKKRNITIATAALVGAGLLTGGMFAAADSIRRSDPTVSTQVQQYYDEKVVNAPTETAAKVIRYAAYGDSISNGNSADFTAGQFGSLSWTSYLGGGISYAGGWAKGGVKTETMLENAKPITADALVLIVGANDYVNDVPFTETAANIIGMVEKTDASRVIISAVPPRDETPLLTAEFNANLQALAAEKGWKFIDAPAGIRTANNTYAPGMTTDGVHPTADAARILGEAIRAALIQP